MQISDIVKKINNKEDIRYSSNGNSFHIFTSKLNDKIAGYEIIIRLTGKCNYRCLYCVTEANALDKKSILTIINKLSEADLSESRIVLSGGEPTISPIFLQILTKLVNSRCSEISVQTNAAMFSNKEFVSKLPIDSRISFYISYPSSIKEKYNLITKSNCYDAAVKGIKNISLRYAFNICIVVCSLNYRDISSTIKFIEYLTGKSNFYVNISNTYIETTVDIDSFIIKYSKVKEGISRAFSYAEKKKTKFLEFNLLNLSPQQIESSSVQNLKYIRNIYPLAVVVSKSSDSSFPYCVLPSNSDISSSYAKTGNTFEVSYGSLDKKFYKSLKCLECKYDKLCPGFNVEYVKRFGTEEIIPFL